MTRQGDPPTSGQNARASVLGKRVDAVGWGLFLIMVGAILLVPREELPKGIWIAGVGLILLGTNAARLLLGIRMNLFLVVLGVAALAAGASRFFDVKLPVIPILLVLLGLSVIVGPLFRGPKG
ncbi:MAG: hypothetical protein ACYTGV_15655 [Planctomycetota bacterium]|jgi:hypothetical protein